MELIRPDTEGMFAFTSQSGDKNTKAKALPMPRGFGAHLSYPSQRYLLGEVIFAILTSSSIWVTDNASRLE